MAANRPFANLDRLASLARPEIVPFNPKIQQGGPTKPIPIDANINQGSSVANKAFNVETSLGDRYEQRKITNTNHLAQFFLSDTATNVTNGRFRTSISLANRLEQPGLGTTNHLSQFFLSDTFTGIIRVKTVVKETQGLSPTLAEFVKSIKITKPSPPKINGGESPQEINFTPQQGSGESPTLPIEDVSTKQGIIIRNDGQLTSDVTILFPTTADEKLVEQGGFVLGGVLRSAIETQLPAEELEQGGTDINPTTPPNNPQGGTEPKASVSALVIEAAQGIIRGETILKSAIQITTPVKELPQGIVTIGSGQQSLVSLTEPAQSVNQGFTDDESGITISNPPGELRTTQLLAQSPALTSPSPVDSLIRNQGIVLDTLGYLARGLTLRIAPTLVQGGELPSNEVPGDWNGHAIVHQRSATISLLLNPPAGTTEITQAQLSTISTIGATGANLISYFKAGDPGSTIQFVNVEDYPTRPRQQNIADLLNSEGGDDAYYDLVRINPNDKYNELMKQTSLTPNSDRPYAPRTAIEYVDGQYNVNTFVAQKLSVNSGDQNANDSEVTSLLSTRIDSFKVDDYKKGFKGKVEETPRYADGHTFKFYDDISQYDDLIKVYNSAQSNPQSNQKRPESTLTISSRGGGDSVSFTAFIKSFSDGLTVNYTDFKHIGVQDTFKTFTGATRAISLAFSVVAMPNNRDFFYSDNNAKATLGKIDKLMKICGVGTASGLYIAAPIVEVTVAGLFSNLICACGTVKVDSPVNETAWDVDSEIPQHFDVSLDLAVLAMANGSLLNKSATFYKG